MPWSLKQIPVVFIILIDCEIALKNLPLTSIVGGTAPPKRYKITLALVRSFGHVPHLIRED